MVSSFQRIRCSRFAHFLHCGAVFVSIADKRESPWDETFVITDILQGWQCWQFNERSRCLQHVFQSFVQSHFARIQQTDIDEHANIILRQHLNQPILTHDHDNIHIRMHRFLNSSVRHMVCSPPLRRMGKPNPLLHSLQDHHAVRNLRRTTRHNYSQTTHRRFRIHQTR